MEVGGRRLEVMAPLARLRQLQEHVIRVEHRDDEPRAAVAESAAQHVVAQERERWMAGDPGKRRDLPVGAPSAPRRASCSDRSSPGDR